MLMKMAPAISIWPGKYYVREKNLNSYWLIGPLRKNTIADLPMEEIPI